MRRVTANPADAQAGSGSIDAERPVLVYTDREGRERDFPFKPGVGQVTVGRGGSQDLVLGWDEQVSRLHARFECVGEGWTVADDGLSSNGTFLNGERVTARRRLTDGDVLRLGNTTMSFREPGARPSPATPPAGGAGPAIDLSTSQRRVLAALCRPYMAGAIASPPSDQQISDELFLTVGVVRKHLSVLFAKLDVGQASPDQMRARLVERAFQAGVITRQGL